jgi:adenine/guanine/hypoxanthine permease
MDPIRESTTNSQIDLAERKTETTIQNPLIQSNRARSTIETLVDAKFYKQEDWVENLFELLFKIKKRGTTVKAELYYGIIHFISCFYVMAVIPQQLSAAGYDGQTTVVAVGLCTGTASIFCGLFANLPFVLAPPTVVSIFIARFLLRNNCSSNTANISVVVSGVLLVLLGWRPLGKFIGRLIPLSIQAGTAIGIGLMTALAGSTEIDLVIQGKYAILKMGKITPEVWIAFTGVVIIAVCIFYHIKGSFCLAVIFCSIVYWANTSTFPSSIGATPILATIDFKNTTFSENEFFLTSDLLFLYILYLNGLLTSLSNLASLSRDDSTVPRGRWIYIMCGIFTIIAGLLSAPPILVSPESSASIKEGAKTGLSTVVCGFLFLLSIFLAPLFRQTPAAGTSPVLIMIGVVLFQNASRVDWRNVVKAVPAFIVLFYIPFTYSVVQGKVHIR